MRNPFFKAGWIEGGGGGAEEEEVEAGEEEVEEEGGGEGEVVVVDEEEEEEGEGCSASSRPLFLVRLVDEHGGDAALLVRDPLHHVEVSAEADLLPHLAVGLLHALDGRRDQQGFELLVLLAETDCVRVEAAVEARRVEALFVLLHVRRPDRVRQRPARAVLLLRARGLGDLGGFHDVHKHFVAFLIRGRVFLECLRNEVRLRPSVIQ